MFESPPTYNDPNHGFTTDFTSFERAGVLPGPRRSARRWRRSVATRFSSHRVFGHRLGMQEQSPSLLEVKGLDLETVVLTNAVLGLATTDQM